MSSEPVGTPVRRVVSLVPSLTEAVAALGCADRLVAVTRYCRHGAPDDAVRLRGTKTPSVEQIVALEPDLVLCNVEENRRADAAALEAAGVPLWVSYPCSVSDVPVMLEALGAALGVPERGAALAEPVVAALGTSPGPVQPPVRALVLVWRKPWIGLGPATFAGDLLTRAGFRHALDAEGGAYPRLRAAPPADVVLLPSEPYAFGPDDLGALAELCGDAVPSDERGMPRHRFVDGELLTWHGPRTGQALETFRALATELADAARADARVR